MHVKYQVNLAILIGCFMFFCCQKKEPLRALSDQTSVPETQSQLTIKTISGSISQKTMDSSVILYFSNFIAFQQIIDQINQLSDEELDIWEKQFPSYISRRTLFNQFNQHELENLPLPLRKYEDAFAVPDQNDITACEFDPDIESIHLATLVNKDGL